MTIATMEEMGVQNNDEGPCEQRKPHSANYTAMEDVMVTMTSIKACCTIHKSCRLFDNNQCCKRQGRRRRRRRRRIKRSSHEFLNSQEIQEGNGNWIAIL